MLQTAIASRVRKATPRHPTATLGGVALALSWLLLLLLVVLPLDVYFTLPPHPGGIFLSQIIAVEAGALLLCTALLARLLRRRLVVRLRWRDAVPLGLVLLAALASLPGSRGPDLVLKGSLKIVAFLCIYVLARTVRPLPGSRRRALWAVTVAAAVVIGWGLAVSAFHVPDLLSSILNVQHTVASLPGSQVPRAESTFRYPNELASYLLLALPLLGSAALLAPGRWRRALYALLVAAGFWLLLLTYTRGALAALVLVVPLYLVLVGGRRWGLAGAAVCLALLLGVLAIGGPARDRLLTVFSSADAGYVTRANALNWAAGKFLSHPLFGIGLDTLHIQPDAPFTSVSQGLREQNAENMVYNLLAELGLFGFLVVAACLVGALRRAWAGIRSAGTWHDRAWNLGLVGGLAALLLYGLVDPVLPSGQVTGLLCALIGLTGAKRLRQSDPQHAAWPEHATDEWQSETLPRVPAVAAPPPARTVFLINSPGFGGAELHALNLAGELQRGGARVLVVVPPGAPLLARVRKARLPVRVLPMGLNAGRWRGVLGTLALLSPRGWLAFRQTVRTLAAEEPSIFVAEFPREQVLTALLRLPTIWVVHAPFRYTAHRLVLAPLWKRLASRAEEVVATSPWLAARLCAEGLPANRLCLLPNAVMSQPVEAAEERVPALLGAVTRLVKSKGIQHLLDAMPAVLEAHPTAQLVLAGTGNYEAALRRQVYRLGLSEHVHFVGYLSRPERLLRSIRLYVCPTVDPGEVLPTAIMEAMNAGVPVVASALASIPDLVRPGQTGTLTAPGDAPALARAIIALLDDPARAEAMGQAGQRLVASHYAMEHIARQFAALLTQAAERQFQPRVAPAPRPAVREQMSRLLLNNTGLLLASKVATAVGIAWWTVLAARSLAPDTYGHLVLAAGLVDLISILTDAGLANIATRELATASEGLVRSLTGTLLLLKLGLGGLATLLLVLGALLLPQGTETRTVLLLLAPSLLFVSLNSLTLLFRARLALRAVVAVALAVTVAGSLGTLVVALLGGGIAGFALLRLATAVAGGVLVLVLVVRRFRPVLVPNGAEMRRMLEASLVFGFAIVLSALYYRMDVPLLAVLADSTQVAIYASAYRVLDVVTLLPISAAGVALPLMAGLGLRQRGRLLAFTQQYLEIAVAAGLGIGLFLTLTGRAILDVLYGGRYAAAAPVLAVLAWACLAVLVTNVFSPLAAVLDARRVMLLATLGGLGVNLMLNLLLIPRLGAVGPAYATLATEVAVTIPLAWMATRRLGWRIRLGFLTTAVLLTLGALLLGNTLESAGVPGWVLVPALLGVWSAGVWAAYRWRQTSAPAHEGNSSARHLLPSLMAAGRGAASTTGGEPWAAYT